MAVTYGFYDSLNHDRLYNAQQMSAIFDGIINDGVFMSVGNQFHTVAGTGMQVIVKSGRAWFDSTWTLNDAEYPLSIDAADVLLTRIDAVVLEVNSEVATRANTIKVVKGTPASTPAKPTLTNTATIHQHALAYVTVAKNTTAITNSMIEIVVGKTETPYVTAILQTTDITDLFNKWENDFQVWFETVRSTLDGDIALNLQNQIDALTRSILKNDTKTALGYNNESIPDDIFKIFTKINDLYIWRKEEIVTQASSTLSANVNKILCGGSADNRIWCSLGVLQDLTVDKYGNLQSLTDTRTIYYNNVPNNINISSLKNKYFIFLGYAGDYSQIMGGSARSDFAIGDIFYFPSNATLSKGSYIYNNESMYAVYANNIQMVTLNKPILSEKNISSMDSKHITSSDDTYSFGKLGLSPKIEYGKYIGTGVVGIINQKMYPTSLSFNMNPYYISIFDYNSNNIITLMKPSIGYIIHMDSGSTYHGTVKWSNNTVSWCMPSADPNGVATGTLQLNRLNDLYYYIAIGI